MPDENRKDANTKTATVVPDDQLDAVSGGKSSTTSGKANSLQVGPAPAKPIDSGGTSTTQI